MAGVGWGGGGGESLIGMGSGENRRGSGIGKYRQLCREVLRVRKLTIGALAGRDRVNG